jgi:hypothetical protein
MADQWLADYEAAKQAANETLQLIQVCGGRLGRRWRLPGRLASGP